MRITRPSPAPPLLLRLLLKGKEKKLFANCNKHMTSCLAFMTSCLAFMTSCFASASCCTCFASLSCCASMMSCCFVLCSSVDVLRALLRRRDLLFARDLVCFARRRALRDAVLCSVTQPSAVSQFPCFVCPCLCSPSLSLAFPCIFLFLSGRKNTNTAGPGLRLLAFDVPSSTCFFWRCKPSNRKFLRASRRFVLPAL